MESETESRPPEEAHPDEPGEGGGATPTEREYEADERDDPPPPDEATAASDD